MGLQGKLRQPGTCSVLVRPFSSLLTTQRPPFSSKLLFCVPPKCALSCRSEETVTFVVIPDC